MPNGQQPSQPVKETLYINFFGNVDTTSVSRLMAIIQQGLKQGRKKFCLFISSPGGNLMSGIVAYNFLKSIPNEITTYNYGYTDSAAVLIFCAGSKRYCLPKSRFVFHEVVSGKIQGSKKILHDNLNLLDYDAQRYISIISDTTGQPKEKIEEDMSEQTILNPEKAIEYKLVQEIKKELPSLEKEDSVTIFNWPKLQPPQK